MTQIKDTFDDSSSMFFNNNYFGNAKFSNGWHMSFAFRYTTTCTEILRVKRENQQDSLKILDIGCGNKTFYRFWMCNFDSHCRPRINYVGLEYLKDVVEEANKTSSETFANSNEVIQYDLNTQSLHDIGKFEKYDVILLQEILEHVTEETGKSLLKEAKEILSDRGFIIVSSPNPKKSQGQEFVWPENHIQEFTLDEMKAMIQEAGFSIKRVNGWLGKAKYFKKLLDKETLDLYNNVKDVSQGLAASIIAFMKPEIAECYIIVAENNKK